VPEWGRSLDEAEFPHVYYSTFGAIVANMLCLIFPGIIAGPLTKIISKITLPDKDG